MAFCSGMRTERIQCIRCHSTSLHKFVPPEEICKQCHKEKSLTQIVFTGPFQYDRPNRAAIRGLANHGSPSLVPLLVDALEDESEIVRLLTGGTYSSSEVATIIRQNCLSFTPTTRDRWSWSRSRRPLRSDWGRSSSRPGS